jgi:hypothetical protein
MIQAFLRGTPRALLQAPKMIPTHQGWSYFIRRMYLFVTWMASPDGAHTVRIGNLTVHITAVIVDAVSGRWIISVPGTFCNIRSYSKCNILGLSDSSYLHRVGGAVGENNFKFFIQFNGYTALYCFHLVVVMAIYAAKQKRTEVC